TTTGGYVTGTGNAYATLFRSTLEVGATGATFNFTAGLLEWTGGFLNGATGGFTNSGALTMTGPNNKFLGGLLTNNGTMIQGVGPRGRAHDCNAASCKNRTSYF